MSQQPSTEPRCPFGYTRENPGTRHTCPIHSDSDYAAEAPAQTESPAQTAEEKAYQFWANLPSEHKGSSWFKIMALYAAHELGALAYGLFGRLVMEGLAPQDARALTERILQAGSSRNPA